MQSLRDYIEAVIDDMKEFGEVTEVEAEKILSEKSGDVEYAYKLRLSSAVCAGSILGINDCCISK